MAQDTAPVIIRVASIEDQPSMVSLINEAFVVETFLEGERTSAPELRAMFETGEFLIAVANSVLVASVYMEVRGERGYFGMLSVKASRQRTGLGRSMIQAAEQHCRAKGCKSMELTVLSLRAELPALYRKFEYDETGREPFQTTRLIEGNPPCELIHMSKPLQAGLADYPRSRRATTCYHLVSLQRMSLPAEIVCAHSPDSDDAYMFYALATRKIRSNMVQFRHVLGDIQTLNQKARAGEYELTAISYHAYPYVADKYQLMAAGSSIGDGYGPMVVASHPLSVEDLKGKRIAIPGRLTTAYLTMRLMQPDFEAVDTPFDKILNAVQDGKADAGLIIHEAQLTYSNSGFHNVIDLGRWFKDTYDLPLPLGANALRRDLNPQMASECCRLMRESIQYAIDHREEALNYALQFARDMDPALAEKFVGMYVNHYTVDCGEVVPKAAQKLLDMGYEAGLIPHRVQVEFVR